ncbi:MAG: hypothetical protein KGO51_01225 [Alphaproteobacteria bacterium]|nr:hypothetical protein [Alphaproteobacteria bacterium]
MAATTARDAGARAGRFYVSMAGACALIAFGSFAETYWLQLPAGTFVGAPIIHVHAVLFSGWTLLLLSQTVLVANGRLEHHRAWGLAGVALASAMVWVGLATAVYGLKEGLARGHGDGARAFLIVPVTAIGMFAAFFAAAIANLARPEWHKRLIMVASVTILQAAVARLIFVLKTGGGPGQRPGLGSPTVAQALGPALLVELLLFAGVAYDWRTRGRPHPAYLIGIAITAAVAVLRIPASETTAWRSIAEFLGGFA